MTKNRLIFSTFGFLLAAALLGACGGPIQTEARYPTGADRDGPDSNRIYDDKEGIFGGGGLNIFGGRNRGEGTGDSGIAVNSFLWRASLDTVSFMPLASADPFGGVILTDWYSPPEKPDERLKLNVFILGRELRSDGVRVRVFRQERRKGEWIDVDAAADTARKLEDAILTRARQLRVARLQSR